MNDLFINDGSTDDSEAMPKKLQRRRMCGYKSLSQEGNKGRGAAQRGIDRLRATLSALWILMMRCLRRCWKGCIRKRNKKMRTLSAQCQSHQKRREGFGVLDDTVIWSDDDEKLCAASCKSWRKLIKRQLFLDRCYIFPEICALMEDAGSRAALWAICEADKLMWKKRCMIMSCMKDRRCIKVRIMTSWNVFSLHGTFI